MAMKNSLIKQAKLRNLRSKSKQDLMTQEETPQFHTSIDSPVKFMKKSQSVNLKNPSLTKPSTLKDKAMYSSWAEAQKPSKERSSLLVDTKTRLKKAKSFFNSQKRLKSQTMGQPLTGEESPLFSMNASRPRINLSQYKLSLFDFSEKTPEPKATALSRWFSKDGSFEWRECLVLEFDAPADKFLIQWPTGKQKVVTRINLKFPDDSPSVYDKRIQFASKMRLKAIKFATNKQIIDMKTSQVPYFPLRMFNKILKFVKGTRKFFSKKPQKVSVTSLPMPLTFTDLTHVRTWKKEITHMLSYRSLCKQLNVAHPEEVQLIYFNKLESILLKLGNRPFLVNPPRIMELFYELLESFRTGVHTFEVCPSTKKPKIPKELGVVECLNYNYSKVLWQINKKSQLAHPSRLQVVKHLKEKLIKVKEHLFFAREYAFPQQMQYFSMVNKVESDQLLKIVEDLILDTQSEIQSILLEANNERVMRNEEKYKMKVYESQEISIEKDLNSKFLRRISRLAKLCNLMIESEISIVLNDSINLLVHQITKAENKKEFPGQFPALRILLEFDENTEEFKVDSDVQDFHKAIEAMILYPYEYLSNLNNINLIEIHRNFHKCKIILSDKAIVRETIDNAWDQCHQFIQEINAYKKLMKKNSFSVENIEGSKLLRRLRKYTQIKDELIILSNNQTEQQLGLVYLKTENIMNILLDTCNRAIESAEQGLLLSLKNHKESISSQSNSILKVIGHVPINLEELSEMRNFINNKLQGKAQSIVAELKTLKRLLDIVEMSKFHINLIPIWSLYLIPEELKNTTDRCLAMLEEKLEIFTRELQQHLQELFKEIELLEKELEEIKLKNNKKLYIEMEMTCSIFKDRLEKALNQAKVINVRQRIINAPKTIFRDLENVKKVFYPFYNIWMYIKDFSVNKPLWMKVLQFYELNKQQVSDDTELYSKELIKMLNTYFKGMDNALELAQSFKKKVDKFLPYVPLIQHLKNPTLKDRHWNEFQRLTKISFLDKKMTATLSDLISEGIMTYIQDIENVSDRATKEQVLEKQKLKMTQDWIDVQFILGKYKNTDFTVIIEPEPIAELIDDHLIKTNSMYNSPYVDFFKKDVIKWKNTLEMYQDILEEWMNVQSNWQYLYPLFQNKDIKDQLPEATAKFLLVHEFVLTLMNCLNTIPYVVDIFAKSNFLGNLKIATANLEQISKSLTEYLNTKRRYFPRFYFLSDDELLSILSNSRDISMINTFIDKCFEGIDNLEFDGMNITAMVSPEGEYVKLWNSVSLLEDSELKYVENWMNDFEASMISSLKFLMIETVSAYSSSSVLKWMQDWPSQLVLTQIMLCWTSDTELAIANQSLRWHSEALQLAFESLAGEVRQVRDPKLRQNISSGIVLGVHNRDIVDTLIENDVQNARDFDWISQLRYYFPKYEVEAQMIFTTRKYNYEYIGNQSRLVITPLTDRCYRTLMSALQLNLGGAPEGPAGTGKTETTKDLAKALAIKCVVFNCSDRLDHLSMARFFTGLVSCGSWSCFDEFNRIETEVLSVIAEQILTIQNALVKKAQKFFFIDELVPLKHSCAIFITMNPDYGGRSQLPDNLKALFRPVAMMMADYSMIAEIYLYSYGFKQARILSNKLITCLKLASEQLSVQHHYDYGLRTVISIIKTAGVYKLEEKNAEEKEYVLRALYDCNLPKFLPIDTEIFTGIATDLFPSTNVSEKDYSQVKEKILSAMKDLEMTESEEVVKKALEFYSILQMRHGVMLVGDTFTCKSSIINLLAYALGDLGADKQEKSKLVWVFAKAMKTEELYGDFDMSSHDWNDGVISHYLRLFCSEVSESAKWIVCDGPVDPVWIETMNTVLDDNKKLCLTSGEIIKLTQKIGMIFEVDSLVAASPATVSRCGMIYLNSENLLQPQHLFEHWMKHLPLGYHFQPIQEFIRFLFNELGVPCLVSMKQFGSSVLWLTKNLLNLFESFLLKNSRNKAEHNEEFKDQLAKYVSIQRTMGDKEEVRRENTIKEEFSDTFGDKTDVVYKFCLLEEDLHDRHLEEICNLFMFSIVWSLGGSISEDHRPPFDENIRNLFETARARTSHRILKRTFHASNCYSLNYDIDKGKWVPWTVSGLLEDSEDIDINNVQVPTLDTMAYQHTVRSLVTRGNSVLIIGATGTGKSVLTKRILAEAKSLSSKLSTYFSSLSPRNTAGQLQDVIFSKLVKRKKNLYGAELGKQLIIVIDDLHMPTPEKFTSAQPANELLREILERHEWFKHNCELHSLEDLFFIGIANLKHEISPRMLRHMFLINFNQFSHESLKHIFSSYLNIGYQNHSESILEHIDMLTDGTIEIYRKTLEILPPTPTKSHYQFNLRDISNIFRGMISVPFTKLADYEGLCRLWVHECLRVFSDRLVSSEDFLSFKQVLSEVIEKNTSKPLQEIEGDFLLFCNFSDERVYQECPSLESAKDMLNIALADYNSAKMNKTMNLEMFEFAIQHVSRIGRVLSTPMGNGLIIGSGGSGRLSLSKLAASSVGCDIFEIKPTKKYGIFDWREDIKKVLLKAGVESKSIAFILRESNLNNEEFLENINNLLNNGEIPNLHSREERETIANSLKYYKTNNKESEEKFEDFTMNVRNNLHIILCFSPIGESLRMKIRLFPSFVNCCTIDWIADWPDDALISLVEAKIDNFALTNSYEQQTDIQKLCFHYHKTIKALSRQYYDDTRRRCYITPHKYVDFLNNIRAIYIRQNTHLTNLKQKFTNGVAVLLKAQEDIKDMSINLRELKGQLVEQTKENELLMEQIKSKNEEVDRKREIVYKEQKECAKQAGAAEKIKNECERILNEAKPVLRAAEKAIKKLDKKDLALVRTMQNPPEPIRIVIEAVVVLYRMPPVKVQDPKDLTKFTFDYWESGKKMMQNVNFLKNLLSFDSESIDESVIYRLQPYLQNPKFLPEIVKYSSISAEGLCKWVQSMNKYYYIRKDIQPKEAALDVATVELNANVEALRAKENELQEIESYLQNLREELDEKYQYKMKMESEAEFIEKKLERARTIIHELGGEQKRWNVNIEKYSKEHNTLLGDSILSAAIVTYLGSFIDQYRVKILYEDWLPYIKQTSLTLKEPYSLKEVFGKSAEIQNWIRDGLPNDTVSIDNALIMQNSGKWPLIIDPQGQANKWLKKTFETAKLQVVQPSTANFDIILESAMSIGSIILMENVGETLDITLDPLLNQEFYQDGGSLCIKVGDSLKMYEKNFKLYLTTRLPRPTFSPEIVSQTTVLDFTITGQTLSEQLLGVVCKLELPVETEELQSLISMSAQYMHDLEAFQDKILELVQTAGNRILDDEELINTLTQSRNTAKDIKQKLKTVAVNEERILEFQKIYRPISEISSVLYFCTADMANIDPMYVFSIEWFLDIFSQSIADITDVEDVQERISKMIVHFREALFYKISMSLFEKDKLLYVFNMTIRLLQRDRTLDSSEWKYLLTGFIGSPEENQPNPSLDPKVWKNVCELSQLESLRKVAQDIATNPEPWKDFIDSPNKTQYLQSFDDFTSSLPCPYGDPSKFTQIQRLCVLRAVKQENMLNAIKSFIYTNLGEKYLKPPLVQLSTILERSSSTTPMIYILTPGHDPSGKLAKFAEQSQRELITLSLGRGQEAKVTRQINEAMYRRDWVLLQNCHLDLKWLDNLLGIINAHTQINMEFRIWLTTFSHPRFPVSLLQAGQLIISEPPQDLRANLQAIYTSITASTQESRAFYRHEKPEIWRKLLFSLSLFHCTINQRKKFGALGWNIQYSFIEADFLISMKQLQMLLEEHDEVPFKTLNYLVSECNYGGKITDSWDRRTIQSILKDFYNDKALKDGYVLNNLEDYEFPIYKESLEEYIEFIEALPYEETPEIYGLHPNASISFMNKELDEFFTRTLHLQPSDVTNVSSKDSSLKSISEDILNSLPEAFDLKTASETFRQTYEQSLNTILLQELEKFNVLLAAVKEGLQDLLKAIAGAQPMNWELEQIQESMLVNRVPESWKAVSFASCKPLSSWVTDISAKVTFFRNWISMGNPQVYWISAFFFPQAFFTAIKQNEARNNPQKLEIDKIQLHFFVNSEDSPTSQSKGCFIRGLFLEGARWHSGKIHDPLPKELFDEIPLMSVVPTTDPVETENIYPCPIYKTSTRSGTEGSSNNYIITANLPTDREPDFWIKRGVAILTQLDD